MVCLADEDLLSEPLVHQALQLHQALRIAQQQQQQPGSLAQAMEGDGSESRGPSRPLPHDCIAAFDDGSGDAAVAGDGGKGPETSAADAELPDGAADGHGVGGSGSDAVAAAEQREGEAAVGGVSGPRGGGASGLARILHEAQRQLVAQLLGLPASHAVAKAAR